MTIKNLPELASYLEAQLRSLVDIAVVGISGGVDSSVVAALCVTALGPKYVHLVSMPYDKSDQETFNARSTELANKLNSHHHTISIGNATNDLESQILPCFNNSVNILTRANIRPRIRMSVLYAIAGELGYSTGLRSRVIGTGHLSEDLIGYDTKGGDALCDIFIISDLLKSEVYQLATYYNIPQSIIDAEPSAGLFPGQTDKQELGFSYEELEPATLALFQVLQRGVNESEISCNLPEFNEIDPKYSTFVVNSFKRHSHKHKAPVTIPCRNLPFF